MAMAAVLSRAQLGMDAPLVRVEIDLAPGLPRFAIVGLAEAAAHGVVTVASVSYAANLRSCKLITLPATLPPSASA